MKKVHFFFLFLLTMFASTQILAQTVAEAAKMQEERIKASYLLAFNREATSDEVRYYKGQGNLTVLQLLERHKEWIKRNPGLWDGILRVSFTDAFGRTVKEGDEYNYHYKNPKTYFEMMNGHMQYINQNPALYDEIIRSTYLRSLFQRKPTDEELNHWRAQPKVSWIWLLRTHNEYAISRKKNSVSTKGLKYIEVSAQVLSDTRLAITSLVAAGGRNIVAAGGGNIVAAGAGNIVAAGAGNIVGNASAGIVAAGAGN